MTKESRNRFLQALAIACALLAGNAQAIGLGGIHKKSALHQPFDARIALTETEATDFRNFRVSLGSQADFERAGIERHRFLTELRFSIEEERGRPVVRVTSREPITEPYIQFLVEAASSNGRLLKVYTLLLDPTVPGIAAR